MIHWPFILGSYALALVGTAGLAVWSLVAMRRAERAAEAMTRPRREP